MTTPLSGQPTVAEFWGWSPASAAGGNYAEISLQQSWLGISTFGGSRLGIPALRGSDIEVPFRSGLQWRPKYPNARTITMVMWVAGVDQATDLPSVNDQTLAWNTNFQQVREAFWNRGSAGSLRGLLTRRWYFTQQGSPQLVTATAAAEVAGTLDPTMTGRTRADFSVDLLLSDPYFYGPPRALTVRANGSGQATVLGEGPVGEGQPGGQAAFTVTLTGPLSFPVLSTSVAAPGSATSFTTLTALSYQGAIPAGVSVFLDILAFTAADSTGANVVGSVKHSGARPWLAMAGGLDSVNTVSLATSNGADTGTAVLSWADAYI